MTAHRIGIFTIDFPDPATIRYENKKFSTLNESVSFQYKIYTNIQTLSTKGVDGSDPYGLLYVPDLASDACKREEQQHVPANATRLANLPAAKNYALIAAAPWFSPQCMLEYFAAARRAPTNGVYVWQPGQGNGQPPVLNDPSWNLLDGGGWQRANTFPTYALPATTGDIIMARLNQYSGNVSTVPYANQLAQSLAATDYVRLWSTVSTESGTQLPSLWVFLVIVLAILIVAVGGISIAMHVIQRRRRNQLRQRVLQGEVDLEVLGVKRLHVDQQTLDKLPIYTYTVGPAAGNEKHVSQPPLPAAGLSSPPVDPETGANPPPLTRLVSAPTVGGAPTSVLSQPTCPICLDDFEVNQTQVRELPCRHIFHPDCIDTFLLRNSSLCPMCKHSVLPPGACPVPITNMMVRRERHIARMRARSRQPRSIQPILPISPQEASPTPGPLGSVGRRIGGAMAGRQIFSASGRAQRPPDIEMANNSNDTTPTTALASANPPTPNANTPVPPSLSNSQDCSPTQNRREWARQRALQMLGNRHAPASDVGEVDTRPKWRRAMNKVFPGFR